MPTVIINAKFSCGMEKISDLSVVQKLKFPPTANTAHVVVMGAAVLYTDDGSDPKADMGMPLDVKDHLITSANPSALKFIQQGPGASLLINYYS